MAGSIHEYMRQRIAEAKKGLEADLAEMRAKPIDPEEEVRCMWAMILGTQGDYYG